MCRAGIATPRNIATLSGRATHAAAANDATTTAMSAQRRVRGVRQGGLRGRDAPGIFVESVRESNAFEGITSTLRSAYPSDGTAAAYVASAVRDTRHHLQGEHR